VSGVRDPKFTTRLERGLLHLAQRGRKVAGAAIAGAVSVSDLRLWLMEFNGGSEQLTPERIEAVKREVGVIVVRKLTPEEQAEIAARKAKRQADDAVTVAQRAAAEADRASRVAFEKREREARIAKRVAREKEEEAPPAPVAVAEPAPAHPVIDPAITGPEAVRNWTRRKRVLNVTPATISTASPAAPAEADPSTLPWRKVGTGWVLKSVAAWRPQLEMVAKGDSPSTVLYSVGGDRGRLSAFCTFRLRYFGEPERLTQAAAAELLAFVDKVGEARVAVTTPRVRSREPMPAAGACATGGDAMDALVSAVELLAGTVRGLAEAVKAEGRAA
jgi:hypothetical protein